MDTTNITPNQNEQPITPPVTTSEMPTPEASIPASTPDTPNAQMAVPSPVNAQPDTDYHGVLNNYKEEMNPPVMETTTTTTAPTSEAPASTTTTTVPVLETPAPDYDNPEIAQKKLEEILNTPNLPPIENSTPVGPAVDTSPKSSIFRTIFLVALFLFLGVSAVIAYFFIKGPSSTSNVPAVTPTAVITQAPTVAPTIAPVVSVCSINDKQYKVGETFAAADGCNICSCAINLTITCTQRVCSSTPSATVTKAATPSAITPTKTITATPTKAL